MVWTLVAIASNLVCFSLNSPSSSNLIEFKPGKPANDYVALVAWYSWEKTQMQHQNKQQIIPKGDATLQETVML
jgi:hypothetical protein